MIQQTYEFLGPQVRTRISLSPLSLPQLMFHSLPPLDLQLAFSLAFPLAEWVTTCIGIDQDNALCKATRHPTATEAVANAL
jgi:hypothetical protein